jgi:hypothetical protein
MGIDNYETFWTPFHARYRFRPSSTDPAPAIDEPTPSVTVDLAPMWSRPGPSFAAEHDAINTLALLAMVQAFPESERLVVLDWQHESWWFRPSRQALTETQDQTWPVEAFPNGDYYAFLTETMDEGTFGHPWERTLCVFGARLMPKLVPMLTSWLPIKRSRP